MLIVYTFTDVIDDDENRTDLEHEKGTGNEYVNVDMGPKVQCTQTGKNRVDTRNRTMMEDEREKARGN